MTGLDSLQAIVQHSLTNYGFENVKLTAGYNAADIQIEYENRIIRNDLVAAGVVMHLAAKVISDSSALVLTPLNRGLPIAVIRLRIADYRRFIDGKTSDHDFAQSLQINEATPAELNNEDRKSSSFRKIDFTIVPAQTIQLGNYEDSFKFSGYLVPEVSSSLWRGAAFRAQVIVPVYDEIGQYTKEVRLSRLALNQVLRLPAGGSLGVSLGIFEPSRYGFSAEVGYFLLNQHFWLGAGLDYTGFIQYQHQKWSYSEPGVVTDKAFLYYFFNKVDFALGIQYGDYLWGDHGWSLHLSRVIGDVKFGCYVAKTDQDKFGGVDLAIPLSPMRLPAARRVRLNWPSQYALSYRATSETITIDEPLMTGLTVSTGYELIDFHKKMTVNYIKNNIGMWKKSLKLIKYH